MSINSHVISLSLSHCLTHSLSLSSYHSRTQNANQLSLIHNLISFFYTPTPTPTNSFPPSLTQIYSILNTHYPSLTLILYLSLFPLSTTLSFSHYSIRLTLSIPPTLSHSFFLLLLSLSLSLSLSSTRSISHSVSQTHAYLFLSHFFLFLSLNTLSHSHSLS